MTKSCVCLPENVGCISLAVVILTTANEIQPTFAGRYPKRFIISDLYRVVTEIAEVHADIARSYTPFTLSPLTCLINNNYITLIRLCVDYMSFLQTFKLDSVCWFLENFTRISKLYLNSNLLHFIS